MGDNEYNLIFSSAHVKDEQKQQAKTKIASLLGLDKAIIDKFAADTHLIFLCAECNDKQRRTINSFRNRTTSFLRA